METVTPTGAPDTEAPQEVTFRRPPTLDIRRGIPFTPAIDVLDLRPEIAAFAVEMENRMRENDAQQQEWRNSKYGRGHRGYVFNQLGSRTLYSMLDAQMNALDRAASDRHILDDLDASEPPTTEIGRCASWIAVIAMKFLHSNWWLDISHAKKHGLPTPSDNYR
jgi:hypothetical protein